MCIRFSQRKCLEQKQNPLVRWSFTEISGNFWCLTVFMRSLQTLGSQLTYRTKNMQKLQSLCLRKKIKVHGIVPVQSRVNLSIPGALRVSDKKNVPAIVASVKTIFRSLVFKKRMEFHNNQSSATCVFHVVFENSLFILCIHSNKQLAELFWMRKAHKT